MRKTSRAVLIGLIFCSVGWGQLIGYKTHLWKSIPIKSEWEYNNSAVGGEGWQFLHGMTRSVSNPDIIYGAMDSGGIIKSRDGGARWVFCKNRGLVNSVTYSIACDPVNPQVVLVDSVGLWWPFDNEYDGLYRSTNGGRNWTFVKNVTDPHDYGNFGDRYFNHGIDYDPTSIDSTGAATWYWIVGAGITDPDSDDQTIYRSTDYGVTWSSYCLSTGHTDPHDLKCDVNGRILVGSNLGLYVVTTGPELTSLGDLPAGTVTSIAVHPSNANVIWVCSYGNGVYKSTNGGTNFSQVISSTYPQTVAVAPSNPNYLMYVQGTSGSGTPKYSTDGGDSWNDGSNPSQIDGVSRDGDDWKSKYASLCYSATNHLDVVGFGYYRIFKTTDGGATSAESSVGYHGMCSNKCSTAFHPADSDQITFGLWDVGVIRSSNGGLYWDNLNTATGGESLGIWNAELYSGPLEIEYLSYTNSSNNDLIAWLRGAGNKYIPIYWDDDDDVWHKATLNNSGPTYDFYYSGSYHEQITTEDVDFFFCAPDTGYAWSNFWMTSDYGETWSLMNILNTVCDDCETTWTGSANVTVADEGGEGMHPEGTYSQKISPNGDFTTGVLAYRENEGNNGASADHHITFKIYSSIEISAGQLQFVSDSDTGCVSPAYRIDLPAIPATTWTDVVCRVYTTDPTNIGLYATADFGACDIYVDDFKWVQGYFVNYAPSNPAVVYATNVATTTIYRSDDYGVTWSSWASLPSYNYMKTNGFVSFAVDPFDEDVIYTQTGDSYAQTARGNFYKYNANQDGGTWTLTSPSLRSIANSTYSIGDTAAYYMKNIVCDQDHAGLIYAGFTSKGTSNVFRTTDYGVTWEDITLNLPSFNSTSLVINPHTGELLAVGLDGTYVLPPPYNGATPLYNSGLAIGD